MTEYYVAQMREVLAGTAEPMRAPVTYILPGWTTNGVYHDIFFDPFSQYPRSVFDDMTTIHNMEYRQYREQRANCVKNVYYEYAAWPLKW